MTVGLLVLEMRKKKKNGGPKFPILSSGRSLRLYELIRLKPSLKVCHRRNSFLLWPVTLNYKTWKLHKSHSIPQSPIRLQLFPQMCRSDSIQLLLYCEIPPTPNLLTFNPRTVTPTLTPVTPVIPEAQRLLSEEKP